MHTWTSHQPERVACVERNEPRLSTLVSEATKLRSQDGGSECPDIDVPQTLIHTPRMCGTRPRGAVLIVCGGERDLKRREGRCQYISRLTTQIGRRSGGVHLSEDPP